MALEEEGELETCMAAFPNKVVEGSVVVVAVLIEGADLVAEELTVLLVEVEVTDSVTGQWVEGVVTLTIGAVVAPAVAVDLLTRIGLADPLQVAQTEVLIGNSHTIINTLYPTCT